MRGAVGASLDVGVLGERVPVAYQGQVPGLIEVVVTAIPINQPIFVVIAGGTDIEAVTTHRARDGLRCFVLVGVPAIR